MALKRQRRSRSMLRHEYRRGPWLCSGILLTIGMIALALALYGVFN